MKFTLICFYLVCMSYTSFAQNKLKIKVIDINIRNLDKSVLEASGQVDKDKNAIDIKLTVRKELSKLHYVKVIVHTFQNGTYTVFSPIQITDSVQNFLGYDIFDLQSYFITHTTPPMKYPLKPQEYVTRGWSPNPENFPDIIPEGKYKVDILIFENLEKNVDIAEIDWYLDFHH